MCLIVDLLTLAVLRGPSKSLTDRFSGYTNSRSSQHSAAVSWCKGSLPTKHSCEPGPNCLVAWPRSSDSNAVVMHHVAYRSDLVCSQASVACTARFLRERVLAAAARGTVSRGKAKSPRSPPKHKHNVAESVLSADELGCIHFQSCSGCSISHQLNDPPIVQEARAFFSSRGFDNFQTVAGVNHGWRCRAKLAVRGKAGDPQIGR